MEKSQPLPDKFSSMSKSAAAPMERMKLLLQNQGEMLKRGNLKTPYNEESFFSFWRGNQANGYFKSLLGRSKEKDGYLKWFAGNVAAGSAAGATTSLFLYHLDYAHTRLGTDAKECPVNGQRQFKGMVDGNFFASFLLGWSVTTVSGVCAYPFDIIRRRMMLTSGQPSYLRKDASRSGREGVLAGYDELHRLTYMHGYGQRT
ncbi:hypothetical protein MKX01_035992 [Papaver californicum]|nr:hypothetical protein MKX01_035992 [Papaver californicum]